MQLHPTGKQESIDPKEILEETKLIGMDSWNGGEAQIKQFRDEMKINDIVLIHKGAKSIALVKVIGDFIVKVIGDFIDSGSNQSSVDWFRYRRKVEILEILSEPKNDFPYTRGTLKKALDKKTQTYQYIYDWYLSLQQKQYNQESLTLDEYKISNIFIDDFKMFKNFTLNLVGTDKKPLPLIVLAGKNGTGKTSILEYLSDYNLNEGDCIEIFKTKKAERMDAFITDDEIIVESFKLLKKMDGILEKKSEYKNHILYLPVQVGDTNDVEERIAEHYKKKAKEYDSFKKSLVELQTYMDTIFKDLELTFRISDVDDDKKKVFFKNANGEIFGAEALSTGEKTLLSKVLYLYFSELKNKIILIDEPELSLHPAWQNRVLKLYENFAIKNNCQIIIATHSPHIIGSAKNESIRVLQKNREGKMEALDHFSQSYGLEFHKILTEIMGVEYLRTPEVAEKLATLKKMIAQNHFDTSEFQEKWQELEEIFGENYLDLKLLKLEIASRRKSVQNH
jgi:predicted ATP-binding protein involved in virulence